MKLYIKHQDSYSRGELLLRTLFGFIYIMLPHAFLLFFVSIWGAILSFIAFWVILFTGRYPESFFEFQVGLLRWSIRVNARLNNLCDGYPAFGINATDEYTDVQVPYPENLSRVLQLVKVLFGIIYVIIPHGFVLIFRTIGMLILMFLAWWVVLFTGNYPKSWHDFNVGTLRWQVRVNLYMSYMTDDYPPFSGRPDPDDEASGGARIEEELSPATPPTPTPEGLGQEDDTAGDDDSPSDEPQSSEDDSGGDDDDK